VHTINDVEYEWNASKAESNFKKHGVRFADAAVSLEDPLGLTTYDLRPHGEERFVFIGADPGGRLLVTIYAVRGKAIRLISSRRATRREQKDYEDSR